MGLKIGYQSGEQAYSKGTYTINNVPNTDVESLGYRNGVLDLRALVDKKTGDLYLYNTGAGDDTAAVTRLALIDGDLSFTEGTISIPGVSEAHNVLKIASNEVVSALAALKAANIPAESQEESARLIDKLSETYTAAMSGKKKQAPVLAGAR